MRWFSKAAFRNGLRRQPSMPPNKSRTFPAKPFARRDAGSCEPRCGSKQILCSVNFWDSGASFGCHHRASGNCWVAREDLLCGKHRVREKWHESLSPLEDRERRASPVTPGPEPRRGNRRAFRGVLVPGRAGRTIVVASFSASYYLRSTCGQRRAACCPGGWAQTFEERLFDTSVLPFAK